MDYKSIIEKSTLFDESFYIEHYRDVRMSEELPLEHFVNNGLKEDRKPNEWFDPVWYREYYEDIKTSDIYPFIHYILYGKAEGRLLSSENINNIESFNFELFRAANLNIKLETYNIEDSIRNGKLSFHPKYIPFNESKYLNLFLDVKDAIKNKIISNGYEHFQKYGYKEIIEGNRRWIFKIFLSQYLKDKKVPHISNFQMDAFLNLDSKELSKKSEMAKLYYKKIGFFNIISGKSLFHVDYEAFDEKKYLNIYPDLIDAIIEGTIKNPIQHFVDYGYNEIITGVRQWPINTLQNKNVEKLRFINFCRTKGHDAT